MNSQKIILPAFIIIVLIQLFVPAKMIWDKESIWYTGTEYKFKTAPVDPTDPFRGKYIVLNYKENSVAVGEKDKWISGEDIYVSLTSDNKGFVKIKSVSKEKPAKDQEFVKAQVGFVSGSSPKTLRINYPFTRFYMEESKAYDAELAYRRTFRDTSKITYALIGIKDGEAVLKDVFINEMPIKEVVKAYQRKNKE